jgi:mRNA-degrading endonuclease RelE of RelBE toxin-antitoxin system
MIFVEGPAFERFRDHYLDDENYRLLQAALMANPEVGDLIRGSGGLRKVRWSSDGKGKRGGLRVIYYWITRRGHILLLTLYHKSEVSDLTPKEVKALAGYVEKFGGLK